MKLSDELSWRGFVNQTTLESINQLDGEPISFYWGVDPSSDSMTIGNLAAGMMARHFLEHGHKAFLLVGGATGMIGDPDGKADERNLKTIEEITKNKNAIADQYRNIFRGKNFEIVDNYDWFRDINYLDFLRLVGKNVPMSQMLGREFVQSRLGSNGSGISYAEFSYSLIQGYDFLHLFKNFGVTMQICGADQWGNSIAGVDLIRRIESGIAHVYSTPLIINKATGKKFGKSEDGAVWLDSNKTSVFRFYQFWLNADDEGVVDYLKVYTMLTKEDIELLEKSKNEKPNLREAQRALAREVTALVHGEDRMRSAENVTGVLFGTGDFTDLSDESIEDLSKEIPVVNQNKSIVEALVETGIANSNGDAKRLIAGGAVSISSFGTKGMSKVVGDYRVENVSLLKKGKNNFILFR